MVIDFETDFFREAFSIPGRWSGSGGNFAMTSSFYLQRRSIYEQFMLLTVNIAIFLLSYAVFKILVPLRRLKAICLKRASMAFLINLVNLARKALLWRCERPKYCSTMYLILEMSLLRFFSKGVNSVPRVALVIMPSAILLR